MDRTAYNREYYQQNREKLLNKQLGNNRKRRSRYILKWSMLDDEAMLIHAFEFAGKDIDAKRYRYYLQAIA